ncbi:MAG TPA: TetR/AcrR family transcriptional regulator C-terminal domain-containing protein, partial [Pirellulales bacterium]|nr:TetR/AcrR family transcriptional regulator C-terminal domain-containing protein [Pirellulales bacterium]
YGRYPTKAALFNAMNVVAAVRFYEQAIPPNDDNLPLEAALKLRARAILSLGAENVGIIHYRIVSTESVRAPELAESNYRLWDRYVEQTKAFFAKRAAAGQLAGIDIDFVSKLFVNLVFAEMNACHIVNIPLPSPQELYATADMVAEMFVGILPKLRERGRQHKESARSRRSSTKDAN